MRCACQALGVHRVDFLGYPDPVVGPEDTLYPFIEDEDELRDRLLANVRRLRPHILLTHGRDGEYGHPAHKLLHRATWAAFQQLLAANPKVPEAHTTTPHFYTFCAAVPGLDDHIFNASEPADLVFELEGTPWLDRKEAAALCHVTQHALFKRRKQAHTVREILRRVESLHRYWPVNGPDAPDLRDG
jgi:LmbE family N-acetylglucosaminyl deacetylase